MSAESPTLYERLLSRQETAAADRPPRPSAAVVPWRRGPAKEIEVYWVRRSPALRFMGGWYAFPGGTLARSDVEVAVAAEPAGTSGSTFSDPGPEVAGADRRRLGPDLAPGLVACAVRELFEETGLLLAAGALGSDPDVDGLGDARRRLLAHETRFADLIADHAWMLDAAPLVFAGRWLTPPVAPLRFDNRFFLLEWSARRATQPSLMGTELDAGEWIAPRRALERWQRGEVLAAPPILHILRVLAEDGPEAGLERLRDTREANLGPFRRIEFRPGVILLPLLTPTLPPAVRTNAYLLGRREAVLVDPATPLPAETELLRRAVAAARRQGIEIRAIWLTHHHRDHVGAVEAMRRDLGVPVCAHRLTAEQLERQGLAVDEELADGQRVELGGDPPFPVRVVHTPGHTRGHLAFFDETHRSLIAGDLTSTLSTIVIDPPEGDMETYLESLDRVLGLGPEILFPAHGPPVRDAGRHLEELKRHRLDRERQVLERWRSGSTEPARMVREIYAELPEAIYPVAERQIVAHLERLRRRGLLGD